MEKAKIYPVKSIPDKLFFKIGEVCELIDVQPHVLRYWESEFPMLTPQKNRAGQRTYRRKDVEVVVRIKQLLYDEGFTIAGAKKKLSIELRGGGAKLKVVAPEVVEMVPELKQQEIKELAEDIIEVIPAVAELHPVKEVEEEVSTVTATTVVSKKNALTKEQKQSLRQVKQDLQALLTMLSRDAIIPAK
jgi:DNA-binding transcriptional MerR regulator